MVRSALRMLLALYMCFNGTGIWGGETMCMEGIDSGLGLCIIRSVCCLM